MEIRHNCAAMVLALAAMLLRAFARGLDAKSGRFRRLASCHMPDGHGSCGLDMDQANGSERGN